ncbi:MAG TPA: hypothetical protein VEZ16_10805 [Microvirga sp.]|nr:hypothetical protein [Microvirga sp.]
MDHSGPSCDRPYPEIAAALGIQEATCRKLVSRARINIGKDTARHAAPSERQDEFLAAFQLAIAAGRTERLAALLSDDVMLTADSGGRVPAILKPVHGKEHVLEAIAGSLSCWWRSYEWRSGILNGMRGVLLFEVVSSLLPQLLHMTSWTASLPSMWCAIPIS